MTTTKTCKTCNIDLPIKDFRPGRRRCITCENKAYTSNWEKNTDIICNVCGENKSIRLFYKNHKRCKSCFIKHQQKDYTPEKGREKNLRHFYGITVAEYNALLEKQGNKCAICETTDPGGRKSGRGGGANIFVVDHCHDTNKVRGILCHRCNRSIGVIGENVGTLHSMVEYLQRHQPKERHSHSLFPNGE
jgi:hypothetical protein